MPIAGGSDPVRDASISVLDTILLVHRSIDHDDLQVLRVLIPDLHIIGKGRLGRCTPNGELTLEHPSEKKCIPLSLYLLLRKSINVPVTENLKERTRFGMKGESYKPTILTLYA